jgi:tetratricopeptide (TPR) repeat protein
MHYCAGTERHAWADPEDAAKCCNGFERAHRVDRGRDGEAKLIYFWRPLAPTGPAPTRRRRSASPPDVRRVSTGPRADTSPHHEPTPRRQQEASPRRQQVATQGHEPVDPPTLQHIPFFERLGVVQQDTPPWRAVSAGLLALRLVDRWGSRHGPSGRKLLFKEFVAVRRAIDAVDDERIRTVLGDIINAVSEFAARDARPLVAVLLDYGGILEDQSEWGLAGDVYATAIDHTRARASQRYLARCYYNMGRCKRKVGDDVAAAIIFQRGRDALSAIGDSAGVLQIRIGDARIRIDRGAFADAAAMLDDVIAGARHHHATDVLAAALHDRGTVAYKCSEAEAAVAFYFEALTTYEDRPHQLRALHDLALQLSEMGERTAARHAFEMVMLSSEQHDVHGSAAINLLDLAAHCDDHDAFDSYRDALEAMALPPQLESLFYIILGDGHRRFRRPMMAEWAYHVAEKIAMANALNEYAERAASALAALDDVPARFASREEAPAVSDSTRMVVTAVGEMRQQVTGSAGHLSVSQAV